MHLNVWFRSVKRIRMMAALSLLGGVVIIGLYSWRINNFITVDCHLSSSNMIPNGFCKCWYYIAPNPIYISFTQSLIISYSLMIYNTGDEVVMSCLFIIVGALSVIFNCILIILANTWHTQHVGNDNSCSTWLMIDTFLYKYIFINVHR